MSEGRLFNCPSCGSSLSADGNQVQIKCPYCGNTVIVPPELRHSEADAHGTSRINIVVGESGTSIEIPDLAALQPKPIEAALGQSELAGLANPMLPASNRSVKTAIWLFVIIMIVSVVVPIACSLLGVLGAFGGILVPFFFK